MAERGLQHEKEGKSRYEAQLRSSIKTNLMIAESQLELGGEAKPGRDRNTGLQAAYYAYVDYMQLGEMEEAKKLAERYGLTEKLLKGFEEATGVQIPKTAEAGETATAAA